MERYREALNAIDWDDEAKETLQKIVDESTQFAYCGDEEVAYCYRGCSSNHCFIVSLG